MMPDDSIVPAPTRVAAARLAELKTALALARESLQQCDVRLAQLRSFHVQAKHELDLAERALRAFLDAAPTG